MKDLAARKSLRVPETFVAFDAGECEQPIHRRFEQQARHRPNAPAVRLQSADIAYAELNAAANRAAHRLLATVRGDTRPIAMLMSQGYVSIVWTMAILKAGFSYAPLDQRLPYSVLRRMIEDLEPCALIADIESHDASIHHALGSFPVITAVTSLDEFASENLDQPVSPESGAYVFYTSGSTGAPKGVADSHRNVLHNVMRYTNTLRFAPSDTLSLVQNPSFSGTVSSLFGALVNGATVAPYDLRSESLPEISQWLRDSRATVFHAVPSIFRQLSDPATRFPAIRLVRLEGDRVSSLDIKHFKANFNDDCTLVNGLGATECGLVRQFFIDNRTQLESSEPVPAGYPVPDMIVSIADDGGHELAPGSVGEVVVESKFLATGYWRNPGLSAERFVEHHDGVRRYRTKDLGSLSADGCLTLLGRVDHRIRIAGEFVDSSEIETALLRMPEISQAVLRDYTDEFGDRRLCAYVVVDAGCIVTVTQLREALSERIAGHLVPTAFILIAELPLTKDLKIDYERLPPPGRQRPPLLNDYVAPQSLLEQQLAYIWTEVLEIDQVGATDSFLDLGGDSLHATRIVSRIKVKHGLTVSLSSLFQLRTIRALVESLEED